MTPGTHIVAAVQFEPARLDAAANLARAEQLAFEAAAKGAQVVVLPELCVSGPVIETPQEAARCAQVRDGHQTQRLARVASRFGCHVVFGYVESCQGALYSSAALVGPEGLAGNAQKHNLWGTDHLWARPSEAVPPIVPTPVGRIGILLGRDVTNSYRRSKPFSDPSHRFYRPGSVDVLCLLTCWFDHPGGLPDFQWVDLAEETRANVVVANACGAAGSGGSCVIDRRLRVWAHGTSEGEAVVGGMVLV